MNINNLMAQANKMQKELEQTQKEIDVMEFIGKSQFTEVLMDGKKIVKKVTITQTNLTDHEDIEMLEDMIVLAFNDAISQVNKITDEKMGKYTKALKGIF